MNQRQHKIKVPTVIVENNIDVVIPLNQIDPKQALLCLGTTSWLHGAEYGRLQRRPKQLRAALAAEGGTYES